MFSYNYSKHLFAFFILGKQNERITKYDQLYSSYIIVHCFAEDNELDLYYNLYTMLVCFSERDKTLLTSHIDGDISFLSIKETSKT